MIKERIIQLRKLMQDRNIDTYIIPTSDYHESEYVGEYFQARKYLSGFTGSAGMLVITMSQAYLLTDGRYFIQAESQLKETGIKLLRSGEKGVPNILELVFEKTPCNGTVAFDGKVINAKLGIELGKLLNEEGIKIKYDEDLVDYIWDERPALTFHPLYELDRKYAGRTIKQKLKDIRLKMFEYNAKFHILTSLDDIAWLYNFRGSDVLHNPVALSYTIIGKKDAILFVDTNSLNESLVAKLQDANVTICEYASIYTYLKENNAMFKQTLVELSKINYTIYQLLEKESELLDYPNPTTLLKSIKNKTEIKNIKSAHIKDGVAVTKFMYWLKNTVSNEEITEISATQKLLEFRKMQEGFLDVSFDTITAYKEHAAMMHYSATKQTNAVIEPEGMLLVDSGGHYMEGTTDITRTFVLGDISQEMKLHYTTVVKSMLRLANVTFLYGCNGHNFDILARGPIWDLLLDYKCGTGHGVGYLLSVHEAPNGFRWRSVPERSDSCIFEPGMVTTDEPGIYVEGSHGIRIENELLCTDKLENEYGRFLTFETITLAPIDLDGIVLEYLENSDKILINKYHKMVYNKISPYLTKEEKEWLKEYTKEL